MTASHRATSSDKYPRARESWDLAKGLCGISVNRQLLPNGSSPLNAASRLEDLTVPRSNRLEKLKGDLKDFHSIRINAQWRVIFKWFHGEPYEVRIVDYH